MTLHEHKPRHTLGSFSIHNLRILALVMLLGLFLRVLNLGAQPLWWDEGYSVFFATRDFGTMLARTAVDIHPPLYYGLLQIWIQIFGKGDVALRWLSVVIGVAAFPVFYLLAKRLYGLRVAYLALFLLAIAPFHIYYSQEVRMYGLVTLFGLLSVYFFARLLEMRTGTPRTALVALVYVLSSVAALYTQYYAAFLLAFQFVYVIVAALKRNRETARTVLAGIGHWLAAWALIFILYLPWLVYAGSELYRYVRGKVQIEASVPLDPVAFLAQHLVAFSVGHLTNWGWLSLASAPIVLLVLLALVSRAPKLAVARPSRVENATEASIHSALFAGLYVIVPLVLGYGVNLVFPFHPVHYERLLLPAAPGFYLLAAVGIDRLWQRRALLAVATLALVTGIAGLSLYDFYTVQRYPNDDYRPVITSMQQIARPNDVFLAIYPWQIGYLESYYSGPPLQIIEADSDRWVKDPEQMARDVEALQATSIRIWLPALQTKGRVVEDALDAYLRPRDYSVVDALFGSTRLELFSRLDDPSVSGQLTASPDPGRGEVRYGIPAGETILSGDVLPVWLESDGRNSNVDKVSLRLVRGPSDVWAQEDRELESGRQRIGLTIPAGAPPGSYSLLAAFYASGQNTSSSSAPQYLGKVTIIAPPEPLLATVPKRTMVQFQNGMRLLGYAPPSGPIQPGLAAGIGLYWQAVQKVDSNVQVRIRLDDGKGHNYVTGQSAPAHGTYPPPQWQPNEMIYDPQTLVLPGTAPDGSYSLRIGLVELDRNRAVPATTGEWADVGTLQVRGRPHYYGSPSPSNLFEANFGGWARLIGYDVVRSSSSTQVTLYWQSTGTPQISYSAFAHILGADGLIRGQRDQIPGGGEYPTTTWVSNEYLVDVYQIDRPLESGDKLEIGIYDPGTGTRVPVVGATGQPEADHIVLPIDSR